MDSVVICSWETDLLDTVSFLYELGASLPDSSFPKASRVKSVLVPFTPAFFRTINFLYFCPDVLLLIHIFLSIFYVMNPIQHWGFKDDIREKKVFLLRASLGEKGRREEETFCFLPMVSP